jgi:hypothetical protein
VDRIFPIYKKEKGRRLLLSYVFANTGGTYRVLFALGAVDRIFPIYKKEKGRRLAWPFSPSRLGKIRWAYDRPRSATARCTAYRGARPAAACRPWPASGRRGAVADGGQERAREEQQQRADEESRPALE